MWWFPTYFHFHPLPGVMIQFDEQIFQMGGKKPLTIFEFRAWWKFFQFKISRPPPRKPPPKAKDPSEVVQSEVPKVMRPTSKELAMAKAALTPPEGTYGQQGRKANKIVLTPAKPASPAAVPAAVQPPPKQHDRRTCLHPLRNSSRSPMCQWPKAPSVPDKGSSKDRSFDDTTSALQH